MNIVILQVRMDLITLGLDVRKRIFASLSQIQKIFAKRMKYGLEYVLAHAKNVLAHVKINS